MTSDNPYKRRLLYGDAPVLPGLPQPRSRNLDLGPVTNFSRAAARLSDEERGLVMSPPVVMHANGSISTTPIEQKEIRSALFFWDRIDIPGNNLIQIALGDSVKVLEDEGVISRSTLTMSRGSSVDLLPLVHHQAFRLLDQADPGRWSLGRMEDERGLPESDLEQGRGVLVKIMNAIPIPGKDVPYADILRFRQDRRPELLAFRHHMERLYQSILNAGDSELALNTEIEALDKSIRDVILASKEAPFALRWSGWEVKYNLVDGVTGATSALNNARSAGLGLSESVIPAAAGLMAGLSIEKSAGLARRRPSSSPFEYAALITKQFS